MAEQPPVLQPVDFDPFADASSVLRLPLTPTQRELFAAVQMGPQAHCAFNLAYVLHLEGPLSAVSMRSALSQVVRRHAALRVRLLPDGSGQEVLEEVPVDLPLHDLGDWTPEQQQQALAEGARREAETPFDLGAAPLWRAQLLRLSSTRHALFFTVHHLVSDGWSSAVLFGDLARAYAADRFGMQAQQPTLASYVDYVRTFERPDLRAALQAADSYWLALHADPAPALALPLDRPRPTLKTFDCGHVSVALDAPVAQAVRQLGARHGCTFFVTLLAAFQALMARLTGAEDLVVGIPMAHQSALDNGHLVTHGAYTVPLRGRPGAEQPFAEHLRQVRGQFLDAQAHPLASFGNLVNRLKLPRDPSRTPLVDVVFNIDRLGSAFEFGDLRVRAVDTPKTLSNAELSVNVVDDGRSAVVECHYNRAILDGETVVRWLRLYVEALQRLAAAPQLSLADAFAPTTEECQRLDAFNATATEVPRDLRLEQLVARRAAEQAQAPAVWSEDRVLSFGGLDALANGVGRTLLAMGVKRGDRVGLFCARHERMVAGVLGILKAGATYVPLDPAFPAERLAFMAEDARLAVMVCDHRTESAWAFGHLPMLRLDDVLEDAQPLPVVGTADDLAYVMYTSGSTGQPKGVEIPHRTVVNFVSSLSRYPGLSPSDRMAAVATLSFDISVMDLFLTLACGASVVVVPREEAVDGQALRRRLASSGATAMQAAPSVWRLLVDAGWPGEPGFRAFVGGEALPPDLAEALLARCAGLWNLYGPTETTVYSTLWPVTEPRLGIRVGKPIANTQIHVLDSRLRRLPLGVVGEICIGGDGVARGYRERPALTAERFVPDPFRPGHRLYRTGDLGRWHADGQLECLGRIDHQIKLRGYRIELGEIEAALLAQPGIAQAVAVLREDRPGDARLVAYLVADGTAEVDTRGLRDALRRRLPEYMLPSHVVVIEALPLLPNGKLDRRALPAPSNPPRAAETPSPLAALSPDEEAVAAIWRELLDIDTVGPTDNFFDLGGHSLLAARASTEIRKRLGFSVTVPRLVMESLTQVSRRPVAPVEVVVVASAAESAAAATSGGWLRRLMDGWRRG